ncbi:MAG: PHP domain-containing protein, partial [Gemmatimonadetes bacterium]|nr:PHP domain-containing protein [Gemmatimonadota bacterium]
MTEQTRPPRTARPGAPFVPLHLQSHFSLLHGTASLAELATWLEAEGIEAAALVDRNNVYGAVFWHAAMAKLRRRAITGAEVDGAFRVDGGRRGASDQEQRAGAAANTAPSDSVSSHSARPSGAIT